jgi:S1-C subfamily serine protease
MHGFVGEAKIELRRSTEMGSQKELLRTTVLIVLGLLLGRWGCDPDPTKVRAAPSAPSFQRKLVEYERATVDLFQQASPSVVFITSLETRRDMFSFNVFTVPRGNGSGFVWDREGRIVTNYHVIQGASVARVTLNDHSTWKAELVGAAPEKDIAVLRIDAPAKQLQPLPLGTAEDLKVGQSVFAIGNPFGFDQTLTTGIVSAIGREIESAARIPIRDVIQTDAAINPGNSGGPLLDSGGELVGVNTAIYSPSGAYAGIGFAIPVDTVRWVVPDLIKYGKVIRPILGVEVATPQMTRQLGIEGVLVIRVTPNSGAAEAGLRPTTMDRRGRLLLGDVIVAVASEPIRSSNDLFLALERRKAGEVVKVSLVRDQNRTEVEVRLDRQG